jgi:polysaccharide biosynthesis transport protein
MNTAPAMPSPKELCRLLVTYKKRWLVPAAVVALAVGVYASVAPATWEAAQALIVRNEAANNETGPGKFKQPDDMKTVQETILELVRSRGVLEAALREVGPDTAADSSAAWPSERDIDALRKQVKLAPPKGAEFGKTEIFYLDVRATDRERAIALSRAICGQMQACFQQLRDAKAASMTDELVKTVSLAQADLKESTQRLTTIET